MRVLGCTGLPSGVGRNIGFIAEIFAFWAAVFGHLRMNLAGGASFLPTTIDFIGSNRWLSSIHVEA
jgi:hypothetical protein